jgi:C-terminal peptidase prc
MKPGVLAGLIGLTRKDRFMFQRKLLMGWLLLAGLLLSAPAVRAGDEDAQPGQTYVVLVGINKYQDPQIKSRLHAEADAQALYDLLTSKDHLGVPADHIKLLLGSADAKRSAETATRANIAKALTWLEKLTKPNDLVIFGFLGEGAPLGDRSCYFAVDSTFKDRAKNGLAGAELEGRLEKVASERFVGIVDVNFLGFDPGKEPMPDFNNNGLVKDFLGSDDTRDTVPSRVVLLPNNGLKPSLDLEKHGILTQVILDALRGRADAEGYEPDGKITANELIKYLRKELPILARKHGGNDDEKGQLPVVIEGHTNDFVVDLNPTAHARAEARLKAFKTIAADKDLAKDIAQEGFHLLSQMPKLEAQQSLRKAYQQLADGKLDVDGFQGKRKAILDSMKLSDRDASQFALVVLKGARVVRDGFFKDTNQGSMIEQAIDGLYKAINEKTPPSLKEKLTGIRAMKEADLSKLLSEARQHLGKREDLDKGKDVSYALNAMLTKLDKHTYYYDPDAAKALARDTSGKFSGIGVQIRKNNVKDQLQVVTPIYGSPAYKAGLKANDIIATIVREVDENGKKLAEPEIIPTKGMTTEDAVKKILGKAGTPVKLLIEREGNQEPLEFNLIRGSVEVESVLGHKRNADDTWNYVIDPDNKICYVRLTQFSENTAADLAKLMKQLYKTGIKGFVLDLRFNPGGLLDSAIRISDLFIDDGLIVTIRPRNTPAMSYLGKSDGSFTSFPMAVLVNGGSASASEIVSACLQDNGRAVVVGSRSYGKGSVQTIQPFDTGNGRGKLKLTTATFWRPNGRNLNRASTKGRDEDEWGVTPNDGFNLKLGTKEQYDLQEHLRDQEIIHPSGYVPSASKTDFHDRQLDMALEYLRGQIRTASQQSKKPGG